MSQGIGHSLVDRNDRFLERQVAEGCRLLYLESPTKPTLKVLDLWRRDSMVVYDCRR